MQIKSKSKLLFAKIGKFWKILFKRNKKRFCVYLYTLTGYIKQ